MVRVLGIKPKIPIFIEGIEMVGSQFRDLIIKCFDEMYDALDGDTAENLMQKDHFQLFKRVYEAIK